MEDKRDVLKNDTPFSYKKTKDGKALVYWQSRHIVTVTGRKFDELVSLERENDEYKTQMFLAKVTGNFKHGNER